MKKFIVLKYEHDYKWKEIRSFAREPATWEATDAGEAFNKAVINNDREKLDTISYLVLPWDEGCIFNVSVNVMAKANSEE